MCGAVPGVFHEGDAADDGNVLEYEVGTFLNDGVEATVDGGVVHLLRTPLFSEADHGHLRQSRFDLVSEVRVQLYAVRDQYGVGVERDGRDGDRTSDGVLGHRLDGHGIAYLTAESVLRDSVLLEDAALALGGRPAVASHRGEHERVEAAVP